MSSESDSDSTDTHLGELVIIRHRADHDGEGHHGGVWKIAYADFMTAMMAFFLVMWLINAANEETKAQVASYFNPIKLIDSRTSTKGLQDLEAGSNGKPEPGDKMAASDKEQIDTPDEKDEKDEAKEEKHEAEEADAKSKEKHQAEGADPKSEDSHEQSEPSKAAEGQVGPGTETVMDQAKALELQGGDQASQGAGEAYLDPFDPQSWQQIAKETTTPGQSEIEQQVAEAAQSASSDHAGLAPEGNAKPGGETSGATGVGEQKPAEPPTEAAKPETAEPPPAETKPETKAAEPAKTEAEKKAEEEAKKRASEEAQRGNPEAQKIASEIKSLIGNVGPGSSPVVEVRKTGDGVLISLTDSADFGMFEISSARPRKEMVRFMQAIAKVLNERKGNIIVSGHTDGRPFRSETYDNWRLSSARAQMAYDMLVEAGIGEKRVERIEGHADRALKKPDDPEAAQNRRIEILLRETDI